MMAGDFDVSDTDFEGPFLVPNAEIRNGQHWPTFDRIASVTTLLNSIIVVTERGKVYKMTPSLVTPTWEQLPDVPLS